LNPDSWVFLSYETVMFEMDSSVTLTAEPNSRLSDTRNVTVSIQEVTSEPRLPSEMSSWTGESDDFEG